MYVDKASVEAEFDALHMMEALDDDRNGAQDSGLFAKITARVDKRIQAAVAVSKALSGASPPPQLLNECGCVFACAMIFRRRGVADSQNPFAEREKALAETLDGFGKGDRAEKGTLKVVALGSADDLEEGE